MNAADFYSQCRDVAPASHPSLDSDMSSRLRVAKLVLVMTGQAVVPDKRMAVVFLSLLLRYVIV